MKLYLHSRTGMIGARGQPTLFLLSLGFGLGPTFARAGRGDHVQFLAPGIVTMAILSTAVFSGIGIIWDRHFGFLKETLLPPVSTSRNTGKITTIKWTDFRGILQIEELRRRPASS